MPFQRIRPALPQLMFDCSALPTPPTVARQRTSTYRLQRCPVPSVETSALAPGNARGCASASASTRTPANSYSFARPSSHRAARRAPISTSFLISRCVSASATSSGTAISRRRSIITSRRAGWVGASAACGAARDPSAARNRLPQIQHRVALRPPPRRSRSIPMDAAGGRRAAHTGIPCALFGGARLSAEADHGEDTALLPQPASQPRPAAPVGAGSRCRDQPGDGGGSGYSRGDLVGHRDAAWARAGAGAAECAAGGWHRRGAARLVAGLCRAGSAGLRRAGPGWRRISIS